ncbi:MAG TPA: protease modulator HflC [Rhizomicrobium sp.]|nr:protease modulator HflC [Rhizomicrobium sp.]
MNRGIGLSIAVGVLVLLGIFVSCVYTVSQTQQVLLVQFGAPVGIVNEPGLHAKLPWQTVYFFDRRLLNLDAPSEEVIALDKKRILVDAFARWRILDPLLFYQSNLDEDRLQPILSSNIRRVLGSQDFAEMLSARRTDLMHQIRDNMNRDVRGYGVEILDVRIRHADLPQQNSQAIYQRMTKERERQATEYRAQGDEIAQRIRARAERERTEIIAEAQRQSSILRGEGDAEKTKITAAAYGQDPNFYAFWRSMQAYQDSLSGSNTTLILSPKSDFFKYLGQGAGPAGNGKR